MKRAWLGFLVLAMAVSVAAAQGDRAPSTLFQVSTLQALMQGQYEGSMTLGALKRHGDTGLGTFDALDGEMVFFDGTVYQVRVDGSVHTPDDSVTTPFANVAFLNADDPAQVSAFESVGGMEHLEAKLHAILEKEPGGVNRPWVIRVDGTFRPVTTRSVPRQEKPYRPLAEVAREQREFSRESVAGTIVGFYFPGYMKGINISGFHLHLLSDERDFGGHLLQVGEVRGTLRLRPLSSFSMILPDALADLNLDKDMTDAIHDVERTVRDAAPEAAPGK